MRLFPALFPSHNIYRWQWLKMDIRSPLNKIFTNTMNNYAAGGHTKRSKKDRTDRSVRKGLPCSVHLVFVSDAR